MYRARIQDCIITTPQLATAFRVSDRLVVSAAHPFDGIRSFELLTVAGDPVGAELVALVPEKDLAVLLLDDSSVEPYPPLAQQPVERETAVQFFHFDNDGEFFQQDGSVLRRARVTLDGEDERFSIELAGEIVAGDSGSPVVAAGEVVGVVFATARGSESGWAVAASELTLLLDSLPDDPPALGGGCVDS